MDGRGYSVRALAAKVHINKGRRPDASQNLQRQDRGHQALMSSRSQWHVFK
jgi:hypothetical protein